MPNIIRFNDISYNIISIADNAFKSYTGLNDTIIIPSSITSIGKDAFNGCINIVNIAFMGDKPNLGTNAFLNGNYNMLYYIQSKGWDNFDFIDFHPVKKLISYDYEILTNIINNNPEINKEDLKNNLIQKLKEKYPEITDDLLQFRLKLIVDNNGKAEIDIMTGDFKNDLIEKIARKLQL